MEPRETLGRSKADRDMLPTMNNLGGVLNQQGASLKLRRYIDKYYRPKEHTSCCKPAELAVPINGARGIEWRMILTSEPIVAAALISVRCV